MPTLENTQLKSAFANAAIETSGLHRSRVAGESLQPLLVFIIAVAIYHTLILANDLDPVNTLASNARKCSVCHSNSISKLTSLTPTHWHVEVERFRLEGKDLPIFGAVKSRELPQAQEDTRQ